MLLFFLEEAMRCLCPLEDRECPGNCAPKDRAKRRKARAKELYGQGLTEQQIAEQLGVSQSTIRDDLVNLVVSTKSNPAKTASNPKGAGRPKGKKPGVKQAQRSVDATPEQWEQFKNKAKEAGYASAAAMLGDMIAEPEIDRADLSLTAQQKLDLAIKQATRRLEIEIEHRVRVENLKFLQKQLDQYNENAQHYERVLKARTKGILTSTEYKLIWSCLHTDSRNSTSDEKLNRAFNLFTKMEKLVLSEQDSPTRSSGLPTTAEELLARKAKYQAERKARRMQTSTPAHR